MWARVRSSQTQPGGGGKAPGSGAWPGSGPGTRNLSFANRKLMVSHPAFPDGHYTIFKKLFPHSPDTGPDSGKVHLAGRVRT